MSRLTRDGTAEPVSRDQILRHARGQGNIHFPCSADHEQDWQPYPVDPYSAICDDNTYIHTYYFFVRLMPVFSLMPMLEPPFSATRYASFFLFMLVLLLVFVTSFLAAYACFRRLCSSPRFLPLGMQVFLVYARTYARFCDLIFGCLCLFSSIMLAVWRDFDISSLLYLYCFRFARSKARTGSVRVFGFRGWPYQMYGV